MNNFNPELERAHQDGTEWKFGAVANDLGLIPLEIRLSEIPVGVPQFNNVMDTDGCASRSPLNILETKFTYFYQNAMHPACKKWLEDNKYVVNEKVVFNDAFIEILSGTTQNGNSLKAPVDAIRTQGLIPSYMLPLESNMTWEQYMDKNRITPAMYELAAQFKRRFGINYEQVPLSQFKEAMTEDLLSVAGHGWPDPVNSIYPRVDGEFNHAFACVDPVIHALDNYDPFVKDLAPDYELFDWGYSLSITSQNPYPDETVSIFTTLQKFGLLKFFADAIARLWGYNKQPDVEIPPDVVMAPIPPAPAIPTADTPVNKITRFCLAIQSREGYFGPNQLPGYPAGTPAYINKNPGNLRCDPSTKDNWNHLSIGQNNGFCVFKDYDSGFEALKNVVTAVCKGQAPATNAYMMAAKRIGKPDCSYLTIIQYFTVRDPATDKNDPMSMANEIAGKVGISPTAEMRELLV